MADEERGDRIEVGRITIIKAFADDSESGSAVRVQYSDGLDMLDALGMLAFAQTLAMAQILEGDDD